MVCKKELCTVQQLLTECPWLAKGRLRELLFRRHKNGLDQAIVEFGRTILIDRVKFSLWFDAQFSGRIEKRDNTSLTSENFGLTE
jgi:hypothetical protein